MFIVRLASVSRKFQAVALASLLALPLTSMLMPSASAELSKGVGSVKPAATRDDVIINELDADQVSTDTGEFVELYDGGAGNTPLDGLVVVFYNGGTAGVAANDVSYAAFDLDGHKTNPSGYFTLGNTGVAGRDIVFANDFLQNGADAVALYVGDASSFPNGTTPTTNNLRDAIVYDTTDADDAGLLVLLNSGQPQVDENATPNGGAGTTNSNQRCPNGSGGARNTSTYTQRVPTPDAFNTCGGDAQPSVSSESPADDATNVAIGANITVTFTEAVNVNPADWFSVSCSMSGVLTPAAFNVTGGPTTYTIDPATDFANNETCTVTIKAASVTDQDSADPPDAMATDHAFNFTTAAALPTLSINDVSQNEGSGSGTTDFTFTVSLSAPAPAGGVSFNWSTADGTTNPATAGSDYVAVSGNSGSIAAGQTSTTLTVTVNRDASFEQNETFFVNVTITAGATAGDTQGLGTIVNDDAGTCGDEPYTRIFEIQGSAATSPKAGQIHATEGVVIGDFQGSGNLSGFYIQDPAGDGNTATSDGIYVFDGGAPAVDVAVGDRVRVVGTVAETFGNTRINPAFPTQVCSQANQLPAPTVYDLPEPPGANNDLERVENMLVTFPETLTVTGNFTLGRFGELVLSANGRLFQQNSFDRPNTPGALARADFNERAYVVLDDGRAVQNPDPIPYLGSQNTRRAGDTVAGLTGVLTFDFSEYRVHPTVAPSFVEANPRPAAPANVGGSLKVASMNVLNYFTTLDAGANDDNNPDGNNNPQARGADTSTEFTRQRDKIIASIKAMDADVVGLIEVENNNNSPDNSPEAIDDLVAGINAAYGATTYQYVLGTTPGTDAIMNAIIYKPATVTPVGAAVNDNDPVWAQARNPLAQTFQQNATGESFTFIVNHFTSKGCSSNDTGQDADQHDGQGCDNFQRKAQANRLLVFIQDRKTASGDPDVLSMGDYNAYGEEDPNFILEQDASDTLMDGAGGLFSLSERFVPMNERYSYQFDSQFGELDHAFATKSLNNQVTGTTIWHINADEPVVIDYNQEFKKPGTPTGSPDLYEPTPYRSSDHDPLVVGLNLTRNPFLAPGTLIISEFRLSGPAGDNDEFIEVYNNTESPHTVRTVDGSAGYALAASSGGIRFIIPSGTVIPARGYFLGVNNSSSGGYSLGSYPSGSATTTTGDQVRDASLSLASGYTTDIPLTAGIALFSTANPGNFGTDFRLDAVGPASETNTLYKETNGYPDISATARQYSFFRDLRAGRPKDTNDNASDFVYVNTEGVNEGAGGQLGAPGPQNLSSPTQLNQLIKASLIDPCAGLGAGANQERSPTLVTNGQHGTLTLRRTFTNKTQTAITRLRFRVVDITTLNSPGYAAGNSQADLRVLSSTNTEFTVTGADCQGTRPIDMAPLTLEDNPPAQSKGGGLNSTLAAGTISFEQKLLPGQSRNFEFVLGVQQRGVFRFFINVEVEPESQTEASPAKAGERRTKR